MGHCIGEQVTPWGSRAPPQQCVGQQVTPWGNRSPYGAIGHPCSAGKDRTGMTSALILTALGVDDDTIAQDYLLTNEESSC